MPRYKQSRVKDNFKEKTPKIMKNCVKVMKRPYNDLLTKPDYSMPVS